MEVTRDSVHRLLKAVVDSGRAKSFAEAEQFMQSLQLNVYVGPDVEQSPTLQAALTTVINSGRRTFLGGVNIVTEHDFSLQVSWFTNRSLLSCCNELGGHFGEPVSSSPSIVIGQMSPSVVVGSPQLQVTFDGWTVAVMPFGQVRLMEHDTYPVSGVLAGALAIAEAFLSTWTTNAMVGNRTIQQSLWTPGQTEPGPAEFLLPNKLWIVGLGHLGQAVLWTLGMLPYENPHDVHLFLQDDDEIGESNDSTSLLTTKDKIGLKKTRWMAEQCEKRGFRTSIVERRFESGLVLGDEEPEVCLYLPDNVLARQALQDHQFQYVIEAGLGSSYADFTEFVLHTFPGIRKPFDIWPTLAKTAQEISNLSEAYTKLMEDGMDQCGVLMIADAAVGASFVGVVTACLVVSEVVRLVNGGPLYEVIQGDLLDTNYMTSVVKYGGDYTRNYGITTAVHSMQ